MSDARMICPNCGASVPEGTTVCPDCHEDLAALARLEYEAEIHYNEGLALAQSGELDAACKKLITATELESTFAPAHVLLAKVYAQQGLWAEAEASAARALELLPEDRAVRKLATDIARSSLESTKRVREQEQAQQGRGVFRGISARYDQCFWSRFRIGHFSGIDHLVDWQA